ncbi:MAG: hypothetical protein ACLTDS_13020 [Bianqueaceae bacterium]
MLKLIRSELFKLRKRKLFIVLPVLMLLICFGFAILLKGIAAYSDRDWKEDLKKQIVTEQEYIESIDQWEWMTEQSGRHRSEAARFPSWPWRSATGGYPEWGLALSPYIRVFL